MAAKRDRMRRACIFDVKSANGFQILILSIKRDLNFDLRLSTRSLNKTKVEEFEVSGLDDAT